MSAGRWQDGSRINVAEVMRAMGSLARERGARDYAAGITLVDGMTTYLRYGAIREELDAYGHGYSMAMVLTLCKRGGVDVEVESVS